MKIVKRNTREEILLVSEKLFSSFNFNSVSMRDIAEELEISKAALYYHFKSKEDIVMEIMENFKTKMMDELKLVNALEVEPVSKIREVIKIHFNFLHKGKSLLFFMKPSGFNELKSLSVARNKIKKNINKAIRPMTEEAFKSRPKVDVDLAINFFLGILMSLALDEILCEDDKNKIEDSRLEGLIDQIILFMGF